jgi:hypothetical protein
VIDILKQKQIWFTLPSLLVHIGENCFQYLLSISVGVVALHDILPALFVEVHGIEESTLYSEHCHPIQQIHPVFWIKAFPLSIEGIKRS